MGQPTRAEVLHISGILKEWIDWVERGMAENTWDDETPNPGKFVRGVGLCGSISHHPRTMRWFEYGVIDRVLKKMFVADGLDPTYPFNHGDVELADGEWYDIEGEANQMHLNVGRMWWARKIAALTP